MVLQSKYFLYQGEYYKQMDGVMGSPPLSLVVENFYMQAFKHLVLQRRPPEPLCLQTSGYVLGYAIHRRVDSSIWERTGTEEVHLLIRKTPVGRHGVMIGPDSIEEGEGDGFLVVFWRIVSLRIIKLIVARSGI